MEPRRKAQPQGCRGQRGEIPAQRIRADQHSPAREACLLTRQGGRGLGSEARDSEVGSQGEDWGWRREHSLKGVSAPQLARRESSLREKVWTCLRGNRPLFQGARGGDSEHCLNELQRQARAVVISSDTRDGHGTLRLLLQPQRSRCASTGHSPHLPSRELVQPATARVP